MASSFKKYLRYGSEWLALWLLFAIARLLPIQSASNLGAWLTRTIGPKLRVNRIAHANLKAAFPEWDDAKRNAVVDDVWDSLGRYATEFPHMAAMSHDEFVKRVEMNGFEHLHAATAANQPVLFFSCHMGNWELGAKAAHEAGCPLSVVYRPLNNPFVEKMINEYRNHYQASGIPKTSAGGRELLASMKAGQPVALLIDQKMNNGESVPFFGRPAMTSATIADLALKYRCPIIPARIERKGREAKFKVTVYPPVQFNVTGDKNLDASTIMTQLHAIMEGWIRERPGQWLWLHRRWG